jgi:hypothetical protein
MPFPHAWITPDGAALLLSFGMSVLGSAITLWRRFR